MDWSGSLSLSLSTHTHTHTYFGGGVVAGGRGLQEAVLAHHRLEELHGHDLDDDGRERNRRVAAHLISDNLGRSPGDLPQGRRPVARRALSPGSSPDAPNVSPAVQVRTY